MSSEDPKYRNMADGSEQGCEWWRSKSTRSQFICCLVPMTLLFCATVAMATLFALAAMKLNNSSNNNGTANSSVCTTAPCIVAAGNMLQAMDMTADPCKDFYQYSCGGFVMQQNIPAGQNRLAQFDLLGNLIQKELRGLLEATPPAKEPLHRQKSRNYYKSCINRDMINKQSTPQLAKLVSDIGGLFLTSSQKVPAQWTLDSALTARNKYSLSGLFKFNIGADDKNVSHNIIQINQGGLGLGDSTRDYYLNNSVSTDPVLGAYASMLSTYAQLVVGSANVDMALVDEVVMFEQALAQIQQSQADMRDPNTIYHKVDVAWLQQNSPFIDWLSFFNNILSTAKVTIDDKEPVLLYATPYVTALAGLIKNYTSSGDGKRTLQNYIVLQALNDYAGKLGDDYQKAYNKFQTAFVGTQGAPETWQNCVTDTDAQIGFPLGAMFVDAYFGEDAKNKAAGIIDDIIASFHHRVQNVPWMDPATKQQALDKVAYLTHDVAFPDWIYNDTYMNNKYSNFSITEDYVANQFSGFFYSTQQMAMSVHETPDPLRWEMTPPTVNAYYEPTQNKFVVPAGILAPVFFFKDMGVPELINYGAIGTVAGHEITHGFDDQGSQYDKYGNLANWWTNATLAEFTQRAQCIVDQYSNYQVNGQHLNGQQTLGENLADNGGIRTSFDAYRMAQSQGKIKYTQLPGIELTPDQLFFVGYAQVWCSLYTPEAMVHQIATNPHSPGQFRVLGPLSNSPDFATAFNCPAGSPMNPTNKCSVW